jgi:hypothetical protein
MTMQSIARTFIVLIAGSEKPEPNTSQDNPDTLCLRNQSSCFLTAGGGGGVRFLN